MHFTFVLEVGKEQDMENFFIALLYNFIYYCLFIQEYYH